MTIILRYSFYWPRSSPQNIPKLLAQMDFGTLDVKHQQQK